MVLKCILALLTRGQKSFVSKIEPFTLENFDLGHSVTTYTVRVGNTLSECLTEHKRDGF